MAESESERKCLYLERCIQTSSDLKKKESHNSESTQIKNISSILKLPPPSSAYIPHYGTFL